MRYILCFLIVSLYLAPGCYGQTIELIAKEKSKILCDCIEEIDYIDSPLDLDIKIGNCDQLSKSDSIHIENSGGMYEYQAMLINELISNCAALNARISELKESYALELRDSCTSEIEKSNVDNLIVGQYSLSGGGNPEGGAYLFLDDQHNYAITSFGVVIVGKWKVVKEKYLHLIPDKPETPFRVYGYNNPNNRDSTKIIFKGDNFSNRTLIFCRQMNDSLPVLTPILNKDANCYSRPLISKTLNNYTEISLAYNNASEFEEEQPIVIYSYKNTEAFNEFVIFEYTEILDYQPIRLIIDCENLILERDHFTTRQPLPDNFKEVWENMNEIINVKNSTQYKYFTQSYGEVHRNNVYPEKHQLNETDLNFYYLSKVDYEHLNRYELLKCDTQQKSHVKIDENSLFIRVCGSGHLY